MHDKTSEILTFDHKDGNAGIQDSSASAKDVGMLPNIHANFGLKTGESLVRALSAEPKNNQMGKATTQTNCKEAPEWLAPFDTIGHWAKNNGSWSLDV